MARKSQRTAAISLALLAAASLTQLAGCGGSSEDQSQTTTVGKEMVPTLFGLPEPGASAKEAAALSAAGVQSMGVKCGAVTKRDPNGGLVISMYATFVVLVDVQAQDLDAAKGLGFSEANAQFMESVTEVFDCASRSM